MYATLHNALHRVHGNATPVQQFKQLMEINRTALSPKFIDDLTNILSQEDDEYYYKDGIILRK